MENLKRYTMVVRRDENGIATPALKIRKQGEVVKFSDIEKIKTLQWEEVRGALINAPADWGCDEETAENLLELGAECAYNFMVGKIGH